MDENGVVSRSVATSLRLRSGMCFPVGKHIVPDKPFPQNLELVWDNVRSIGLAMLCGGLNFFASLGVLAVWNDKAWKIPFFIVGYLHVFGA